MMSFERAHQALRVAAGLFMALAALAVLPAAGGAAGKEKQVPDDLAPYFRPPAALANDMGSYRSPLKFDDGTSVRTPADWARRRQEILRYWHGVMGPWPPVIERPKVEVVGEERREGLTQRKVRWESMPGQMMDGYLLLPDGPGPFPAALVVFYEPETGVGLKGQLRDFALQLAKRGFVTLSTGTGGSIYWPSAEKPQLQPLSAMACAAANGYHALANLPQVDPKRVGVLGHSYGGKWALLASCLYEKFACAAWSDPGIVFDETRGNVNYWEPWYLGWDAGVKRTPGIPKPDNPRTGAYKRLMEEGRDLHELHVLMAPRPFLVSGGSEDPPERWKALNHSIAVNSLLGHENRVAMTNRPGHNPTPESNEVIYRFFEWALIP